MSGPADENVGGDGLELERYRKLVEASADIVAIVDPDGRVTFVSAAVERVLGYDPDDVVGEAGDEYVHAGDRDAVVEAVEAVRAKSAEPQTIEFRVRGPDDSWYWIEATMRNCLKDETIDGILVNCRPITARKERERDLVTAKERMELALEGANLGIWDWDIEGDEVSRDELLTDMLGYTRAEMGDQLEAWQDIVHPADRQRYEEVLAEHISNRTPYFRCDHRLRTKSGDWKWVRTMGKVVERDEDGTPIRAVGLHQDIDNRKRTKLALEAERDMFREGPAVVFKREDTEGWPVEYVSENVATAFGYTPDDFGSNGVMYADLIHDDDLDRVLREVADKHDAGADRFSIEPYRVVTARDEVRWVLEYTTILPGETPSLLGYLVDITERKEREAELRAREETYRSLFEDTRDALMLLDRDGFFDCNERTLELFGVDSVDAFVEYAPWDLSPTTQPDGMDSKEAALERVETAFDEGESFFEWTHQRVDGTEFPAEVKLSRFEYDGEPALHAMVRDITERKVYERRLEAQRDNLDVLNQVLRHDIRNDIQLITAYADMLADQCDGEAVDEHVGIIQDSADHAVELTVTAREMAEVMLSAEDDLQPVGLRRVLEDELDEVRSSYTEAAVRADADIPSVTVEATDMLGSVFRNLLKNAIQHNDKQVPEVTVSARDRDDMVIVRIADNGPGVPDGQKESIFGKGEKGLDSQGTGIGLYLAQVLVESYGGDIWVEDPEAEATSAHRSTPADTEPEGAVFVVELPKVG